MSYPSSSGFGGLEATPLARVGYPDQIIMRVWERDFLPEITNTTIDERVTRCYQEVQFLRQPKVGKWRRYEKNQVIKADQVIPEASKMVMCHTAYKAIKMDKLDIHNICSRYGEFEDAFLDSCYHGLTEEYRTFVLSSMKAEASVRNKGSHAGHHGNIDLGSPGAPYVIVPATVQRIFARLAQVLRDRQRWEAGKMFVIVPTALKEVLTQSNYSQADKMGSYKDRSMDIDGLLPETLLGFKVIESTFVDTVLDTTGELAYYMIAGHQEAYAFAADIVEGRLVQPSRTYSVEYQMLTVWGGKAIYPDGLAVAYVTIGE